MAHFFPLSTLRRDLSKALDLALHGRDPVIISRHGKRVAGIVSITDLERIWKDENYEKYGPINPDTGQRPGASWVKATGWRRPLAEAEVIAQNAEKKAERDRQFAELEERMRAFDERQAKREAERVAASSKPAPNQRQGWLGWRIKMRR